MTKRRREQRRKDDRGFFEWICTSERAFSIIWVIGQVGPAIIFGLFAFILWYFGGNPVIKILVSLLFLVSLKKAWQAVKVTRGYGWDRAITGMTLTQAMKKDKR